MKCRSFTRERVENKDGTYQCPAPFTLHNDPIGSGMFGTTYEACCGDDCKYVVKWQEEKPGKEYEDQGDFVYDNGSFEREIQFQQRAAAAGISVPIYEIIRCEEEKKVGWVMDRLDRTIASDFDLSDEQQSAIMEYYVPLYETVLEFCQEMLDKLKKLLPLQKTEDQRMLIQDIIKIMEDTMEKIHESSTFTTIFQFYSLYQYLMNLNNPSIHDNLVPVIAHRLSITLPYQNFMPKEVIVDTPAQQKHKTMVTAHMIHLLRKLHHIGILHRDAHLKNYMVKDGKYYLIDFGLAKTLEITPEEMTKIEALRKKGIRFNPEEDEISKVIGYIIRSTKEEEIRIRHDLDYLKKNVAWLQKHITHTTTDEELVTLVEELVKKDGRFGTKRRTKKKKQKHTCVDHSLRNKKCTLLEKAKR